jgi:hypothetical protein
MTTYDRLASKNTGADSDRRAEFSHAELESLMAVARDPGLFAAPLHLANPR